MSESILNKPFEKKDIQRLRNLIQGKYSLRSTIGVGYTKKTKTYEEGDIWEENGRTWTIKDGLKQNVTKLDSFKHLANFPLFCPNCSTLMNHKYDKSFYYQYKRCYSCQINFETEIRRLGLWEEYERNIINTDLENVIKDFEFWMDDIVGESNSSYITESGDIERWIGSAKQKLLEDKEKTINYLKGLKK